MWLIPIVVFFNWFFRITQFPVTNPQRTHHPLPQVRQFMQKSFYIQLLIHISIKFNQELTRTILLTYYVTITIHTFTFQSTMKNFNMNLMTWKEPIQKPSGNVLTEAFTITVSRMHDVRHEIQCKNQMNEETKISLSVVVIINKRM